MMYGQPWYTESNRGLLERRPRYARKCREILGPLETPEDAERWALVSEVCHAGTYYSVVWRLLSFDRYRINIYIKEEGIMAVMGVHWAEATRQQRDFETSLFIPLLKSEDRRVREGAMQLLAGVGTEAAIEPLFENLSRAKGHEHFLAVYVLAHVLPLSRLNEVREAAGKDAWILDRIKWESIHRERLNWNGEWTVE